MRKQFRRGRLEAELSIGHRFGLGLVFAWDGLYQIMAHIGPFDLWVAW